MLFDPRAHERLIEDPWDPNRVRATIREVSRARMEFGRGHFTLWTGDPGTALYLADCLAGGGALPLP